MDGRKIFRIIRSKNQSKINALFEQIYNEYFRLLYFVAFSYINNEQIVEDLVQKSFIDFFNQCLDSGKIKDIIDVKSYLCSVVQHESLKEKKRLFLNNSQVDVDSIENNEDDLRYETDLRYLLTKLNKEELNILINHVFLDRTFKEISKDENIPLNTIKSKYRRAIMKLKEVLKNEK